MELSGLRMGRRRQAAVDAALERARVTDLTYDHVGSTLMPAAEPGIAGLAYHRDDTAEVSGDLAAARAALRRWRAHAGIHATVHPLDTPPTEGLTVVVLVPFGPVELTVPNRVVAVVDEPGRYGFAYGTLPGHPEAGEELFLAEDLGDGRVRLTVRVHARPATLAARLAGPVAAMLQRGATTRYLQAWTDALSAV